MVAELEGSSIGDATGLVFVESGEGVVESVLCSAEIEGKGTSGVL